MLITAAEVATILGVSSTDAFLVSIVKAADAHVKRTCRRDFERADRTEILPGYGGNLTFVRESPIAALTEVRIDACGRFGSDTVIVDLTDFAFDPERDDARLTYLGGVFPEGSRVCKVTLTSGFWPAADTDAGHVGPRVPEDLRLEMISDVITVYKNGANEWFASHSIGDESFTRFASCVSPRLTAAIRRYQR